MAQTQLQVFTSYSLLSSTNRVADLVALAKEYGYTSLAITDLNVMHGVIEFYQACIKQKIQPIIGLTIDYQTQEDQTFKFLLLAESFTGYQNLLRISSLKMSHIAGQPFTFTELSAYLNHVVVITPQVDGELAYLIQEGRMEEAQETILKWRETLPEDALFAGVSLQKEEDEHQKWLDFTKNEKIKIVALHDTRYLQPDEAFALNVLHHINEGTSLKDKEIKNEGQYYLPRPEEMAAQFQQVGLGNALDEAEKIAKRCKLTLPLHQKLLPHFPVPQNLSAGTYLQQICKERLPLRVKEVDQRYWERLDMELGIIHDMGFDDYFLIVWDVMDFAHRQQIVTGAGRGSAAGSLVSYVLSITDVDPIEYHLLFERFLNKQRYTMPDIDLDIPDNRRDEILKYVGEKYGTNHVAQIATFGTMAAKMALRDVCRVFGLSQSEANQWANAVPNTLKITLEAAKNSSVKLQNLIKQSAESQLLFETAEKIEGLPRHVSTHAAGVVISDQNLTHLVPLQKGSGNISLTQFTMGDIETVGLLKMDFLGLRNLSIMDDTMRYIQHIYRKKIVTSKIPLDDEETLQLFRKGQTTGVFQFESAGIRNVLRKLGPTSLEDIAAVNALYRPGPMENIDLFIERKKGTKPIEYPDPSLASILSVTYGVMVYQEQVMQVASKMAGFSLGEADILRRAISKKKKNILDEERQHFVSGALAEGYNEKTAHYVYDYIERFANYGFNRSHAVAYSVIGYQMAYLKVHYPIPFFASLLHSVRHNPTKVKEYIAEAKRYRIQVKGPDINLSEYSFYLNQDEIRFGFSSLKGIRKDFIFAILKERKENGYFKSLENFLIRIERKWLKTDNIIPLLYIGAFDSLESNRKKLVRELDGMIKNIHISGGSANLLELMSLNEEDSQDYTLEEKLVKEEEYLGMYISGHPVEKFQRIRYGRNTQNLSELQVGQKANCLLYVKEVKNIRTKKGESMAFLEGDDLTGAISITVFPRVYRGANGNFEKKQVYYVEGKVERSTYNQELQILAEKIVPAVTLLQNIAAKTCYLKITKALETKELSRKINEIVTEHHGNTPVILFYEESDKKIALAEQYWIQEDEKSRKALVDLLGSENVVFQ